MNNQQQENPKTAVTIQLQWQSKLANCGLSLPDDDPDKTLDQKNRPQKRRGVHNPVPHIFCPFLIFSKSSHIAEDLSRWIEIRVARRFIAPTICFPMAKAKVTLEGRAENWQVPGPDYLLQPLSSFFLGNFPSNFIFSSLYCLFYLLYTFLPKYFSILINWTYPKSLNSNSIRE